MLKLGSPVFAFAGDRFVLRDWSGRRTLAGGVVLDPDWEGGRADDSFEVHGAVTPDKLLTARLGAGGFWRVDQALAKSVFAADEIAAAVDRLRAGGLAVVQLNYIVAADRWNDIVTRAAAGIDAHHQAHPESLGENLAALKTAVGRGLPADELLEPLVASLVQRGYERRGAVVARAGHRAALSPALRAAGDRVRAALSKKPFEPPGRKELEIHATTAAALRFLLDTGEAVAVGDDIVMLADAINRAADVVCKRIAKHGPSTAADLKTALGTTRRVMMPLLEHLDKIGVTTRRGDLRVLREPVAGKTF